MDTQKRIRFFLSLIILTLVLGLFSCKKEYNDPSSAEVTAKEIQNVISANGINRVIPWDYREIFPNSFAQNAGTSFSFSNGFLTVNGFSYTAYNLDKVKTYTITNVAIANSNGNVTSSEKAIVIYFY